MNVLVVDDDVELCSLLSRFLERNGIHVHSASDALQALDILERAPVDLVVTDYRMPHMDGVTFAEQLKGDPRFKAIPIILVTAHLTDSLANEGLRKGVALMLEKPVNFDRLLTLVRFAQ